MRQQPGWPAIKTATVEGDADQIRHAADVQRHTDGACIQRQGPHLGHSADLLNIAGREDNFIGRQIQLFKLAHLRKRGGSGSVGCCPGQAHAIE